MRDQRFVSVVIPCYNGVAYLAEAIESVLAQDYSPLELIVVDDGSRDESAAVASQYPDVRLIRKPHSGVGATLNVGVRHALGELLASSMRMIDGCLPSWRCRCRYWRVILAPIWCLGRYDSFGSLTGVGVQRFY